MSLHVNDTNEIKSVKFQQPEVETIKESAMELHLILVTELVLLCLCVPNILIHGIKDSFSPEELDDLKESGPEYIVLDDYDPVSAKYFWTDA